MKGDKVIERIIEKDGKGDDAKEVIISIKESLAKEIDKKPQTEDDEEVLEEGTTETNQNGKKL